MFRHFVNILVDNAPSYPRLTHSSLLTYPQTYPQMWITAYLQFQKSSFPSTYRLEEHAKKGVYTKWIAHITRDDNRNNHAQHDYAVNQSALLQAFAALTAERSADFFHLQFWHANLYGPRSPALAPQLTILWE